MTAPIVFRDAAKVVIDHLKTVVPAGVEVVNRVPAVRPRQFVLIRRTGGTLAETVVDRAQLTVESWAGEPNGSEAEAQNLAQQVRGELLAMKGQVVGDATVYRVVEFSGPAQIPDPESLVPRFRQTIQVGVRVDDT